MQKKHIMRGLFLTFGVAISLAASAGEENVQLKAGSGRDVVLGHCTMCHSADFIPMNSPFLKRKQWEATVAKMRKVMGAPIPEEQVAVIVDYLTSNYGVPD